ncbi:MAG: alpha/beta fold hydrolase [Pseudomonadota bacterium]|nr:alpha/beta fold hydrolase [Pseudomonadota bacterium]
MTPLWQKLQSIQGSDLNWLWLPGWSFRADVFAPFFDSLPGHHWGADYLSNDCSFEAAASQLAATAPCTDNPEGSSAIWIGWSLGGALAAAAFGGIADTKSQFLVTLATGKRFLSDETGKGMLREDFEAFSQSLTSNPETTLKRFTGLCAQGSSEARSLVKQLKNSQHPAQSELNRTLEWLRYEDLPLIPRSLHLYGHADALKPSQMPPVELNPGESHAFFLTTEGKHHLLERLHQLAEQLQHESAKREKMP